MQAVTTSLGRTEKWTGTDVFSTPSRGRPAGVAALAQQSQERLDNGHQADALAAVDEALVMNPDDIYLTWLKGMIVWMGIDAQTGRQMLVDLFERHPFPDRARPSCRQQQAELARSLDVPYVDPNALFLVGRTDKEAQLLFFDWCHPNADGHQLIGRELASLVRR